MWLLKPAKFGREATLLAGYGYCLSQVEKSSNNWNGNWGKRKERKAINHQIDMARKSWDIKEAVRQEADSIEEGKADGVCMWIWQPSKWSKFADLDVDVPNTEVVELEGRGQTLAGMMFAFWCQSDGPRPLQTNPPTANQCQLTASCPSRPLEAAYIPCPGRPAGPFHSWKLGDFCTALLYEFAENSLRILILYFREMRLWSQTFDSLVVWFLPTLNQCFKNQVSLKVSIPIYEFYVLYYVCMFHTGWQLFMAI